MNLTNFLLLELHLVCVSYACFAGSQIAGLLPESVLGVTDLALFPQNLRDWDKFRVQDAY